MVMSRPQAGIVRIASPASPAAATGVMASTATRPVTRRGGGRRGGHEPSVISYARCLAHDPSDSRLVK